MCMCVVCVCKFLVCEFMYIRVYMHMSVCTMLTSDVFVGCSLLYSLRQGLSVETRDG